jgi:hypothetical protein
MSKMDLHDPFGHLNTNYGQKKGRESNWQFDPRSLKIRNHLDFLASRWHVTYHSKYLDKNYYFSLNLISIKSLHAKLLTPKIVGVPGQNVIWVLIPWPGTKYIIKGKVMVSPKSKPWWILWVYVCPWFVYAPKCSNYALTNLLFGLCRSVWMIELRINLLSPIPKLKHAPLPLKCYKLKSVPQLCLLLLFTFGLVIESIKELGGASPTLKHITLPF